MTSTWRSRIAWVVIAVIIAGLAAWALVPAPVRIDAATVRVGTFTRTVDAEGRTRVRDRYVVSAPVAGQLERVVLKAGDTVARGALVAVLIPNVPSLRDLRSSRDLLERVGAAEADVDRALAAIERARVAHALAISELARQKELASKGFVSRQSLDRAERDVDLRDRELQAALSERHRAEHQLASARALASLPPSPATGGDAPRRTGRDRYELRAPVSGQVLRVIQESETAIAGGAPIVEIGDRSRLEIVADVLTSDATAIPPGAAVELGGTGLGAALPPGKLRRVEPGAFTKVSALGVEEQRVNVVMDFDGPLPRDTVLGDGFRIDVRIIVDRRENVLLVPVTSLFRAADGWAVFAIEGDRARLRKVDIAARAGTDAAIAAGLREGDRVVAYPSDLLRDGVRVRERKS